MMMMINIHKRNNALVEYPKIQPNISSIEDSSLFENRSAWSKLATSVHPRWVRTRGDEIAARFAGLCGGAQWKTTCSATESPLPAFNNCRTLRRSVCALTRWFRPSIRWGPMIYEVRPIQICCGFPGVLQIDSSASIIGEKLFPDIDPA